MLCIAVYKYNSAEERLKGVDIGTFCHVKKVELLEIFELRWASLVAQTVKNLPTVWGTWVRSLGVGKIPGSRISLGEGNRQWQPTPVFLPGEFYRERSLASYSSWGLNKLDMTERLTHIYTNLSWGRELVFTRPYTWILLHVFSFIFSGT